MTVRRWLVPLLLSCLGLFLALCLSAGDPTEAYPPPGSGFEGWTAEATIGFGGAHVQVACNGTYLYMVEDDGRDVYLHRAANREALDWHLVGQLDYNPAATARDAYLDAEGPYVACSWRENAGGTWYVVVALSLDYGATWYRWVNHSPGWNNYEAHVELCGGYIHCAYVSDYPAQGYNRNEVYYLRLNLSLGLEAVSCVSDSQDGVSAVQPCLEASAAHQASVYYVREEAGLNPVWQSWTTDWGNHWSGGCLISPAECYNQECSWPECLRYGPYVMVVCQTNDAPSGCFNAFYKRYSPVLGWNVYGWAAGSGPGEPTCPQLAACGNRVLVVYRDTQGASRRGSGNLNTSFGDGGSWNKVDQLFYANLPVNNPGCIDCCSDGGRFYAAQAGTGAHPEVLTKREDNVDPAASIVDPGMYHNGDFAVSAAAADDFCRWGGWMLAPEQAGPYQAGIICADFVYRYNGGAWNDFPNGRRLENDPWQKVFGVGGLPDGIYDFWVRVYDTAFRYQDAYLSGVIVDRQAPLSSPYVSGGTAGDNGWYTGAPTLGCDFTDQGTPPSGVGVKQYREASQSWQDYGSPFPAWEGDHTYIFQCWDRAGTWSGPPSVGIRVDTRAPDASASIPVADGENGWRISTAAATVILTGQDPAGGSGLHSLQYAWDAPPSADYSTPLVAPEGMHVLYYRARDVAGNWGDTESLEVKADYTDPAAALDISDPNGANGWYMEQPASGPGVGGVDSGSGVFQACYRFDGQGDWNVYSVPFPLLEGTHTIDYYCRDWAGRVSAMGSYNYKADLTNPGGIIVRPGNDSYVTANLGMEVDAKDSLSGVDRVEFHFEGALFGSDDTPPYSGSTNISSHCDGQKVIRSRVYDQAGRWAWTDQVLVKKDTTPPTVEIIEPAGEHWVRGMVTIKADIRDNLEVGRAEFYVDGEKIDERTSGPWLAAWDTSTVANGYHALRVEVWDAAGNRACKTAAGEVTVYVGNNISETNNFAEGCTRPGFDTWLCLQNPGQEPADVTVNYYLGEGQGAAPARTYALPAHSRSTIYVNGDVGVGKDVSIQVTSSKPIVSERPMYFDCRGTSSIQWKGCHTAQGAHFPRLEWYFAEGCTRWGFETWLCLQNPEGREAVVRVEYLMENGGYLNRTYRVAPWSRGTVLVNREVGEGHDVSMHVVSASPVVAERPVYFLYQGMWDGGHNVMGAAQAERDWYFAEGCTRTGFNQWICLMNPNPEATTVSIAYVMEDGGSIERKYGLEPRSRFTVNVNCDVARQHDVSTHISSELPVVVERPMYFLYNSVIDEGSNAMGICKPGCSWYLAEGCTRAGFEEWICLMNPGGEEAQVALRFMLENTSQREKVVCVPPGTRVTVKVNDVVGPDHDVSVEVMSNQPVIVERPMYSIYRGTCPSGDTLSGCTFNP